MASVCRQILLAVLTTATLDAVSAGETCIVSGGSYPHYYYEYKYCDNGCCGPYHEKYCCLYIGAIVGAVIGGIIFLGVVISICCVCYQKNRPGRVIQPASNAGATVVLYQQPGYNTHTQQQPGGHPAPGYGANPAYPQTYGANPAYQPTYGVNPAYPPPYPGNSEHTASPAFQK